MLRLNHMLNKQHIMFSIKVRIINNFILIFFMGRGRSHIQSSDSNSDESPPEHKGKDELSIEERIMKVKHPFEKTGFIDSKAMTPSQRAITCCIEMNDGCASEETILYFIQAHWDFIGKINTKLPNNIPDSRILHINLAVKKKGIPLFVPKENNPTMYMCNTNQNVAIQAKQKITIKETRQTRSSMRDESDNESESAQNQKTETEEIEKSKPFSLTNDNYSNFESFIIALLNTTNHGLTVDEIANAAEKYKSIPGLYNMLPYKRRINAVLVYFRNNGSAFCRDGLWSCTQTTVTKPSTSRKSYQGQNIHCQELKNIDTISLDDLWKSLKAKSVF